MTPNEKKVRAIAKRVGGDIDVQGRLPRCDVEVWGPERHNWPATGSHSLLVVYNDADPFYDWATANDVWGLILVDMEHGDPTPCVHGCPQCPAS